MVSKDNLQIFTLLWHPSAVELLLLLLFFNLNYGIRMEEKPWSVMEYLGKQIFYQ